jgi:hypothetical protein
MIFQFGTDNEWQYSITRADPERAGIVEGWNPVIENAPWGAFVPLVFDFRSEMQNK